jgi:hypothetical protein
MACLKLTFGCFALIGVIVVVLALAVVGLFALGVHHMFDPCLYGWLTKSIETPNVLFHNALRAR